MGGSSFGKRSISWLAHAVWLTLAAEPVLAREAERRPPDAIVVGCFSKATPGGLPAAWEPHSFATIPRRTGYRIVEDASGTRFLRATSEAAASGLARPLAIDVAEYPLLRWEWRVLNVLEGGDLRSKRGDDTPARLYVFFEYEPSRVGWWRRIRYRAARAVYGDIPFEAISYVWGSRLPVGEFVDNAHAPGFVKMLAVRSGPAALGTWVSESRNLREDYRAAFGGDPPRVRGIAIMTDTDATGEQAVADYGDIRFARE